MKREKVLKIEMGVAIFGMFLFLGLFIYSCTRHLSGKIVSGGHFLGMIAMFIKLFRMYKKEMADNNAESVDEIAHDN